MQGHGGDLNLLLQSLFAHMRFAHVDLKGLAFLMSTMAYGSYVLPSSFSEGLVP